MKLERFLVAAVAFGIATFVSGLAWTAFDIYALGHYDYKFGPDGGFTLSAMLFTVVALGATVVFAVTLALRRWPARGKNLWLPGALFGPLYLLLVAGASKLVATLAGDWQMPLGLGVLVGVAILAGCLYPVRLGSLTRGE